MGGYRIVEKVFVWNGSEFRYLHVGDGSQVVIGFHGYGLTAESFLSFARGMETECSFFLFDLPYHGGTRTERSFLFDHDGLKRWLLDFLHTIERSGKVHLLAYSLGGNFALSLMQACPENIHSVALIAADGLAPKPGFRLLTRTMAGKAFFQGFIRFPQPIFFLFDLIRRLKWLPEKVIDFYRASSDTELKRQLLYSRWRSVSGIFPDLGVIIRQKDQFRTSVLMIFSRNDKVIPWKYARKFADKMGVYAEMIELNDGHQLLNRSNAELWQNWLKKHVV